MSDRRTGNLSKLGATRRLLNFFWLGIAGWDKETLAGLSNAEVHPYHGDDLIFCAPPQQVENLSLPGSPNRLEEAAAYRC